VTSQSK